MLTLARILELVNRTRLPTLVSSSESEEPCVVLPLSVYEQLSKRVSPSEGVPPTLLEVLPQMTEQTGPISVSFQGSESPPPVELGVGESPGLRLQDLLQAQTIQSPLSSLSAATPQTSSFEDYFAFEGREVRIFPTVRQKSSPGSDALDELGPTLA